MYRTHMSEHSVILTFAQKHIFRAVFSVNIWCGVFGSQVIGPFVLEERLISERYLRFLEDKLPVSDVPLHIRRESCLQQDGASSRSGRQVTAFLRQYF